MAGEALRIGELARRTGTTPRTIRYWEEIGLLPADEERPAGSSRVYDEATVERVRELARLRDLLGLSLEELRDLVEAEEARTVIRREYHATDDPARRADLLDAALGHLDRQLELVRHRRAEIEQLEGDLVARRERVEARRREMRSAATKG
jgi:DNA-binding transcriptional MerR regulator